MRKFVLAVAMIAAMPVAASAADAEAGKTVFNKCKACHQVGEGGRLLSGGQRQRLALARCLLTNSRLVILDEATSALDAESEQIVQQGIDTLCRDRTVVVVAHRLATIRHADVIIVMDQGRVVEQGSFDELLARGGLFANLHAIATSTTTHRLKIEEAGFA